MNIKPRGYSMPLQRAMTDFGCERSFVKATFAIKEHYGIEVPFSAQRYFTLKHAKRVPQEPTVRTIPAEGAACVIAESDGSFVPIVTFKPGDGDKRKRRGKEYKEVRLCAAQQHGSTTTHYANGGFSNVDRTGNALASTALKAGWNSSCKVHCIGDGASWIAKQAQLQFGYGCYLLDFYHLCEYLQPASLVCAPENHKDWMQKQRERLKQNKSNEVIEELIPFGEAENIPEEKAPVRSVERYLSNRLDQVDYKAAIEKKLPIGSGIIESAHGHIIQDRMKKSGAAWTIENADAMISLRAIRANQQWEQIWKN